MTPTLLRHSPLGRGASAKSDCSRDEVRTSRLSGSCSCRAVTRQALTTSSARSVFSSPRAACKASPSSAESSTRSPSSKTRIHELDPSSCIETPAPLETTRPTTTWRPVSSCILSRKRSRLSCIITSPTPSVSLTNATPSRASRRMSFLLRDRSLAENIVLPIGYPSPLCIKILLTIVIHCNYAPLG